MAEVKAKPKDPPTDGALKKAQSDADAEALAGNFITDIIDADIAAGRWGDPGDASVLTTRFPPEPNGYLHIGHAKSICLNFGLAKRYGGRCYLRFDDTNPVKEEQAFVDAIVRDIGWLGCRWVGAEDGSPTAGVRFASDYFGKMYEWAVQLITVGKAYVDDQSAEDIRKQRGTLTEPGLASPCRERAAEESLKLFEDMRNGEFPDGAKVLRAKLDMASPNINLRDPVMYRVLHARHHRTGDTWCIYPMYDWAHGNEDSIEGITHSICTLEFENHRPLYDWFLEQLEVHHPQQLEFARLKLSHTVMSKRKMGELVRENLVDGWDDPRMTTISGYRRRGFTAESIRNFCQEVGVTRYDSIIEHGRLENAARAHLNQAAPRRMAVLRPLKVVIENWPEGQTEELDAINNPEDPAAGKRKIMFSGTLYIEQDDFMADPPRKFFRLGPGREVRLRYGYFITCNDCITDAAGNVVELRCSYDPKTRGGNAPDGRKVKGALHWVSAEHAVPAEVRLYDRLFTAEQPEHSPKDAAENWDWKSNLNPASLEIIEGAMIEPAVRDRSGEPSWPDGIRRFQFERQGYFCLDCQATPQKLIFNRTVTLKDSWAKVAKAGK